MEEKALKNYLNKIEVFLNEYLNENPNVSMPDFLEDFGSPIEIAEDQMSYYSADSRLHYKNVAKTRKRLFILLSIIIFFCILTGCVLLLKDQAITIVHDGPHIGP